MGRIKSIKSALWVVLILMGFFGSRGAFAVDYWWQHMGGNGSYSGPTPMAACKAWSPSSTVRVVKDSDTYYYCERMSDGKWIANGYILRRGDGCAAPKVYDPASAGCIVPSPDAGNICSGEDEKGFINIISTAGECVSKLRADKAALCKSLAGKTEKVRSYVKYGVGDSPDASTVKSNAGCMVQNTTIANCVTPVSHATGGITILPSADRCDVTFTYTGEVDPNSSDPFSPADPASDTEGECSEKMDCSPKEQPEVNEKSECQYVEDAEGRKVCSSSAFSASPGTKQCATGENGRVVCVTKPTSSTGNKVETKVDTKANADGSTTTTKTDVATKVECPAGPSSCKSTTTTTTTTTSKNANGEVTGTNTQTTCNGDKCSGGSTGGGGGGNNGKGDDTTNCDPSTDPKACEGASTDGGGKKCDAPIKCDGDAVMCAILQQQHKDTCELMADPSDEEKSKFEQDKAAEVAKVDQLQEQLDDKASAIFANFQAKATGNQYAGRCLDDYSFSFMGSTFTLPASQVCPYLALFRYAVVAMAYLAAARIVSRGI